MLFASLSGNLFAVSEPESLAPDSSVGSSGAQDTAYPAASQRGGKALYLQAGHTVVGGLGIASHMHITYALILSHPKLVLLAPYGTWHPRSSEFGRAQFASWALGHGLSSV